LIKQFLHLLSDVPVVIYCHMTVSLPFSVHHAWSWRGCWSQAVPACRCSTGGMESVPSFYWTPVRASLSCCFSRENEGVSD
jgi:hypothetical protein